jgi:alpha-tubulin suppressor-like RCC1 family protein
MSRGYTEIFVWGSDTYGQLGLAGKEQDDTHALPKICSFNIIIKQMACGEHHTAFIADGGAVYVMGNNSDGRLGLGDYSIKFSASPCLVEGIPSFAVEIACGKAHTAVITEEGALYTWGVGQALGVGSLQSQWSPRRVPFPHKVLQVSCGTFHTIWIGVRGIKRYLYGCGLNDSGQLGIGTFETELAPVSIPLPEEPSIIRCGNFHTLVLTEQDRIWAAGCNKQGQLGLGHKETVLRFAPVKLENVEKIAAGCHSAAIAQGELYIWGGGVFGEYLVPYKLKCFKSAIKHVDIGGSFGAALDVESTLWCWGSNDYGQLGVGDYEPRVNPYPILGLHHKKARSIICGGDFAIALGNDIKLYKAKRIDLNLSAEDYESKQISSNKYRYAPNLDHSFTTRKKSPEVDHDYHNASYEAYTPYIKQIPSKFTPNSLQGYSSTPKEGLSNRLIELEQELQTKRGELEMYVGHGGYFDSLNREIKDLKYQILREGRASLDLSEELEKERQTRSVLEMKMKEIITEKEKLAEENRKLSEEAERWRKKFEFETEVEKRGVEKQLTDQAAVIDKISKQLEECRAKILVIESENESLKRSVKESEGRNFELTLSMSQLLGSQMDFKRPTTAHTSVSNLEKSFEESPERRVNCSILSNMSQLKSSRSTSQLPGSAQRSPSVKVPSVEPQTPPTFREGGLGANRSRNSLSDIKARLEALQSNRWKSSNNPQMY